jgi:hypothetical protein
MTVTTARVNNAANASAARKVPSAFVRQDSDQQMAASLTSATASGGGVEIANFLMDPDNSFEYNDRRDELRQDFDTLVPISAAVRDRRPIPFTSNATGNGASIFFDDELLQYLRSVEEASASDGDCGGVTNCSSAGIFAGGGTGKFADSAPWSMSNSSGPGSIVVVDDVRDVFNVWTPGVVFRVATISVLIVLTLVGNALLIAVIAGQPSLRRKRVSVFLVNLAVGDLMVCFVTMTTEILFVAFGEWVLGAVACKLIVYGQIVTLASTTFLLTAMSIDRYQASDRQTSDRRDTD